MITTRKQYTEPLADGRKFVFGQADNGMYYAEIRDWQDVIELATIKQTQSEIWDWLKDWAINR